MRQQKGRIGNTRRRFDVIARLCDSRRRFAIYLAYIIKSLRGSVATAAIPKIGVCPPMPDKNNTNLGLTTNSSKRTPLGRSPPLRHALRATSPASTGEHTPGRVVFCFVYKLYYFLNNSGMFFIPIEINRFTLFLKNFLASLSVLDAPLKAINTLFCQDSLR